MTVTFLALQAVRRFEPSTESHGVPAGELREIGSLDGR